MKLLLWSLLSLFFDGVFSQSGLNNGRTSLSNDTSPHSTNSTRPITSTTTTLQSVPFYVTVTVASTLTVTFVDLQCAPTTSPVPFLPTSVVSPFRTIVTIWTTTIQACETAGIYTLGTMTTSVASPTALTYIGMCPTTVSGSAQSNAAGGFQVIVGKPSSGVATVYTISSGTVVGQSVQTITSPLGSSGQQVQSGSPQSKPISTPPLYPSSSIKSSLPVWSNSSTPLGSSAIPASPGSSSTSSLTSTSATLSTSSSTQSSSTISGAAIHVDIISPTSCPASTPTGRFLGTVAPAVSIYAPIPFQSPPYQLAGTEDDGTPIIFDINDPNTITASYENGTSFSISSDGTFRFIVPGCQYEFTGVVDLPTTTKKRSRPRGLRKRSFLTHDVTVDITLYDQCGNPSPGQNPHLLCSYFGQANTDYSPSMDFLDSGGGLYTGTCPVPLLGTLKCDVAETACQTGTFIGSQAYGFGNSLVCGAVAGGIIAAAAAFTEGAAFLASSVTFTIVSGICSNTLGWLEGKVCAVEFPPDVSTACPQPTVVPTLSVTNWLDLLGHTTLIIGDVTVASSTLVSTTATAFVPACTATGNPLPTIPELTCPAGKNRLRGAVKLCSSCYLSGLPTYKKTETPVDICCDPCCGCCAPCGFVIDGTAPNPPDPAQFCCSPTYLPSISFCTTDACQTETCALCSPSSILATGQCKSNCYDPNLYSYFSITDGARTIYPGGALV